MIFRCLLKSFAGLTANCFGFAITEFTADKKVRPHKKNLSISGRSILTYDIDLPVTYRRLAFTDTAAAFNFLPCICTTKWGKDSRKERSGIVSNNAYSNPFFCLWYISAKSPLYAISSSKFPFSTISPWSMTIILSASFTEARRWVIKNTVLPLLKSKIS